MQRTWYEYDHAVCKRFECHNILVYSLKLIVEHLQKVCHLRLWHYCVSSAGVGGDIVAGSLTCRMAVFLVSEKAREEVVEGGVIFHLQGTTTGEEVYGFLELLVARTYDDGDAIDSGLGNIVNSHAETSADIGHLSITIYTGEQTITIHEKGVWHRRKGCALFLGGVALLDILRESCHRTLNLTLNLQEMLLAHDMRCHDEAQFGMSVEIGYDESLVGWPCAATHEDMILTLGGPLFQSGEWTSLLLDIHNAVEAGVASHGDFLLGNAYACEQATALFVLHIEVGDEGETLAIAEVETVEEYLTGTEDAADAIYGHLLLVKAVEVVIPELVLDEIGGFRLDDMYETISVYAGVEGQIAHHIGTFVVFAHFITGRTEKGEKYAHLWLLTAQTLHQGSSLLELTETGGVEPYDTVAFVDVLLQILPCA